MTTKYRIGTKDGVWCFTPICCVAPLSGVAWQITRSFHTRRTKHCTCPNANSIIINCFHEIKEELQHAIDKHSKQIITANIEVLLNHCVRFYDRQFVTRETVNKDSLTRFEGLLRDYFASDKPQQLGLPSVAWCADQLHLSANYFGDLIKKETGKSAQEYIQLTTIDRAKELLIEGNKSVSEIAYELGFKYPHHLSRLFKKVVGMAPNEYKIAI